MFKVPIDKIIPVTSARAKISSLVKKINETGGMYVLTRGGKPAAILASVEMFERTQKELDEEARENKVQKASDVFAQTHNDNQYDIEDVQEDKIDTKKDDDVHPDVILDHIDKNTDDADDKAKDDNKQSDEQPVKISIK